jgi:hypothetical protein
MDFGISFWTFGTGNDANLFLTNTFLSPVVINPSAHQDYSLSFVNGIDTLLFSGNKINDNLSHHVCLNFSPTGLNSYIDSAKCATNLLAGSNTGNYGFTGIISLFSGFNNYSVNDFLILNRPFEESEISGIYERNIWDFYENENSVYDFSTVPIKNRGNIVNQTYNPIAATYSGRYEDYFSYYYLSGYVAIKEFETIDINNGFSIFSWFARFSNSGKTYLYERTEGEKDISFGLSGDKLYFSLKSGNYQLASTSVNDIPQSGWVFAGCSSDGNIIDMFLNGEFIDSNAIYQDSVAITMQSGETHLGSGINAYIDEIDLYGGGQ